ncbi:MAG: signal recognition particle protein, partial [Erysipelotrichia bacterium]|nr:signal recognition particle protein [Erysipelotrichia bacterium]
LIEQAQEKMDVDVAEKSAKRMMEGKFDLNDMLTQMQQIKKMGSMGKIMKMIPGLNQMAEKMDEAKADDSMKKNEAIILSMTKEERSNPSLMKSSRKVRVANGSGTQVSDVNKLLNQFERTKKAMQQMSRMSKGGMPDMSMMNGMSMPKANGGQKKFVSKLKKRR